ncbi:MAG: pectate lyase [Acidobacteria bacterium]|nr:pectate lyase [Acidobacteriota bacterium]
MLTATAASAQVDTSIVPDDGRTTWAPGVQGGIPDRLTICASLSAAQFGDGAVDASAAIQAAIAACPAGQTVSLSAGTFVVNSHLLLNKGITLRGAGAVATRLVKTNGARRFVAQSVDVKPVIVVGPNRWPKIDSATSVALTADAVKGAMAVTVASPAGFAPGQFVLLDQDDYNAATWVPLPARINAASAASIWASDRVVFQRHNPPLPWGDDPFPGSLTWFSRSGRPLNELKEVVAVDGNTITFSTPVHTTYTQQKQAQLTRYTGANVHVRGAGIEDLGLAGGSDGSIRFEAAAYSWVKNVDNSLWGGEGVGINHSFRIEVRDSTLHDGTWPQPGGGGYAISLAWGSSEVLIENNVVLNVNKVLVVRSSGAGSVVGYNYMDNGYIFTQPEWVEVGLNASHMVGSHHVLFEGNASFNYDSDNTHGNAIAMTVFRNHLVGHRRSLPGMANARGAGLMFGSWWHTFIGNVIGESGRMSGWIYEDPGDGTHGHTTSRWGTAPTVWKLGYDPGQWDQLPDPKVRSTVVRDGNFDFVTGEVRWDRAVQTLPPSLYLTAKPAFFGDHRWPWVDPLDDTKVAVLPAVLRAATVQAVGPPAAPASLRVQP